MDLKDAIRLMQGQGYCLWAGAGVAHHLASAGDGTLPDWPAIVGSLEAEAGIVAEPLTGKDYLRYAAYCGLPAAEAQQILRQLLDRGESLAGLIRRSFLPAEAQDRYLHLLLKRQRALRSGLAFLP